MESEKGKEGWGNTRTPLELTSFGRVPQRRRRLGQPVANDRLCLARQVYGGGRASACTRENGTHTHTHVHRDSYRRKETDPVLEQRHQDVLEADSVSSQYRL